jgi:hypothetical protein
MVNQIQALTSGTIQSFCVQTTFYNYNPEPTSSITTLSQYSSSLVEYTIMDGDSSTDLTS